MELDNFQKEIAKRYKSFDKKSGPFFLMTVLAAEIGELADALKAERVESVKEELADSVFALVSIANIYDIDMSSAIEEKYLKRDMGEIHKNWTEPYLGKRLDEL